MRIAVLSDIHANLPALEAVGKDLAQLDLQDIWCLGDVVGYGGQPVETLRWVQQHVRTFVQGNHDHAVAHVDTYGFNPAAAEAARRHTELLTIEERDFIGRWPTEAKRRVRDVDVLMVHASPDDPLRDYVFPQNALRGLLRWRGLADVILMGHTHHPFVSHFASQEWVAEGFEKTIIAENAAREPVLLVNPGSVGQPRDGDARASYAVLDFSTKRVQLRRVEYDIDAAARAIRAHDLADTLGERLYRGA